MLCFWSLLPWTANHSILVCHRNIAHTHFMSKMIDRGSPLGCVHIFRGLILVVCGSKFDEFLLSLILPTLAFSHSGSHFATFSPHNQFPCRQVTQLHVGKIFSEIVQILFSTWRRTPNRYPATVEHLDLVP